jgi:hypothetical protein
MSPSLALGLVLALASAAALNWGYLAQHGEAAALPALSVRRPLVSLRQLFSNCRWLAGFSLGIGGWALYVVALGVAPLSLVQAISAGGIGLLAWRAPGRLARSGRLAVAAAIGGLVLLGVSLASAHQSGGYAAAPVVAIWLGGSTAAAIVVIGPAARLLAPGVGLGIAAGVLYAAGDVATKAAVGGGSVLWFVPALLACHGLAFVLLQLGFQRGGPLATAGMATLFTNALPVVAGVALYHEPFPAGALGVVRGVAFAAVVVGGAVLARATVSPEAAAMVVSVAPAG